MTLSPDKLAFIGKGSEVGMDTLKEKPEASEPEKTTDLHEEQPEPAVEGTRPQRRRNRGRPSVQEEPEANQILDRMLVPVTIRLQNRTAQSLKRASLERELQHVRPHKVQDIAEEALADWLTKGGYL